MDGAIILAAGAATRMGQTKQLLPFGGSTLVRNAVEQAIGARFDRIAVVVGSHGSEVAEALAGLPIEIVQNRAWEAGMGSSLVAGLRHILAGGPTPDYIAILLADQPLIHAAHLSAMRQIAAQLQCPILAARYSGTLGVPAFFHRALFAELEALPPAAGARHLLKLPGQNVTAFDLPEAATDIDTPADLSKIALPKNGSD
jgi:molybdenum cofactor cytidylyltransferase